MTSKGSRHRPGYVRIIGGEWRGRRLPIVDLPGLRPSGDRVREPIPSGMEERVNVYLVEMPVLATDKAGNPIDPDCPVSFMFGNHEAGEHTLDEYASGVSFTAEYSDGSLRVSEAKAPEALARKLHKTIQRVTGEMERMRFNTAIAALIELNNELVGQGVVGSDESDPTPAQAADRVVRWPLDSVEAVPPRIHRLF